VTTVLFPEGVSHPPPLGRIDNGRIDADNLFTEDIDFVAEAESLSNERAVGRLCQETFTLGVAVRKYARSSADLISLRDQVKRFEERVAMATEEAIAAVGQEVDRVTDPEGGLLAEAVGREMNNLSSAFEAAFDQNDKTSALGRIEESVSRLSEEMVRQAAGAVRQLLDPGQDESPLGLLRSGIVREVSAPLQQFATSIDQIEKALEVQKAVEVEAEKGTAKGRVFEDLVGAALADAARPAGDQVEATGDTTGFVAGSKVGDYVVVVRSATGPSTRIAFECKDSKLSNRKLREELDIAAENRQAAVAVIVLASEGIAPYHSPLMKLADRRYAVVYDKDNPDELPLQVAYQMARTAALQALSATDAEGVDLDFLAQKVTEAKSLLDQVTQVKQGIGTARSGLDRAATALDAMKGNLKTCLVEIADVLTGRPE
jgi:hypothetical protein